MADTGFLNDSEKFRKFIIESTTEKMNLRIVKHLEDGYIPDFEPLKTLCKNIYMLGYIEGSKDIADLASGICEFKALCEETKNGKRSKSDTKDGNSTRGTKRTKSRRNTPAEDKSKDETLV